MSQIESIARAGTKWRVVLDYFYEAEEATLSQVKSDLIDQLGKGKVSGPVSGLIHDGRLVQDGEIIRLSRAMKVLFDALHCKQVPVVPAPIRNVFGPAISAKNIPSAKGMREGSNDHLSWSSKHV